MINIEFAKTCADYGFAMRDAEVAELNERLARQETFIEPNYSKRVAKLTAENAELKTKSNRPDHRQDLSVGSSGPSEKSEALFYAKQTEWLEACKEIDKLKEELAAVKAAYNQATALFNARAVVVKENDELRVLLEKAEFNLKCSRTSVQLLQDEKSKRYDRLMAQCEALAGALRTLGDDPESVYTNGKTAQQIADDALDEFEKFKAGV